MRRLRTTRGGTAGFTLVETLVVVVMIGILAGLALPAIDPQRYRIESGLQDVAGVLQSAQRESIGRQHDVVVTIDAAQNLIQVHFDANDDGTVNNSERVRTWPVDARLVFARGPATALAFGGNPVNFPVGPSGLPTITFRRSGSASSAGGMYLTSAQAVAGILKRQNDTRAIEIVRATGRVEWTRYTGGQWRRGF